MSGVEYNYETGANYFYKTYEEQMVTVPLSLIMRRRDNNHNLNVDLRMRQHEDELKKGQQVVCLQMNLFGLIGTVENIDSRKYQIKVNLDKDTEQKRIHDPYMGTNHLSSFYANATEEELKGQQFFQSEEIEKMMRLRDGVISRLTSSVLVSYASPETGEKMVVDIGLNVKNFAKKQHVPQYVRFVTEQDKNAKYEGARVRSHWEYSASCVEIIKEYHEKYYHAFELVMKTMNSNKAVAKLSDLY